MSEPGIVTVPFSCTARSEVDALLVSSKRRFTPVPAPQTERRAYGVVVPSVTCVAKRFCNVDEAVLMSPPPKLIKVEVETPV